jgi:excinuclease ABC subunit A
MLIENQNSIVIIEHNLDIIKCADYVIDLGPEAGEKGGEIVAVGTPEEIANNEKSYTGKFLKKILN